MVMAAHKSMLTEGAAESAGMSTERVDRACWYVERAVDEGILPLADVLIARHGTIVCHRSYVNPGLEEQGYRLAPDSLFCGGSITKVLVATLVMQQVEQGNLMLEKRIGHYIPEFEQMDKKRVTVRHLLAHSSGLPDELPVPVMTIAPTAQYLEMIYKERLVFQPGTRGSYCTWGFVVLAELLRRVTGKDLEELGQEQLFGPLGMLDTHFGWEAEWRDRTVPVFDPKLELDRVFNRPETLAMLRGDIGAYLTAMDLAAFCQMMLNGGFYGGAQVLSPISIQRMVERQNPWSDSPDRLSGTPEEQFLNLSKGLGWWIRGEGFFKGADLMSPRGYFHDSNCGIRILVDPEYDLLVVFMTSIVAPEDASFYSAPARQAHHTFGTMAFAAVTEV